MNINHLSDLADLAANKAAHVGGELASGRGPDDLDYMAVGLRHHAELLTAGLAVIGPDSPVRTENETTLIRALRVRSKMLGLATDIDVIVERLNGARNYAADIARLSTTPQPAPVPTCGAYGGKHGDKYGACGKDAVYALSYSGPDKISDPHRTRCERHGAGYSPPEWIILALAPAPAPA